MRVNSDFLLYAAYREKNLDEMLEGEIKEWRIEFQLKWKCPRSIKIDETNNLS